MAIVFEDLGDCVSYETISPGDTATGFTASNIVPTSGDYKGMNAKAVLIRAEDQDMNFSIHGTDPTASAGTNVGIKLKEDDSYVIRNTVNIKNFKIIDRVSGTTGTCKAFFFI